jgi:hypothetical protein
MVDAIEKTQNLSKSVKTLIPKDLVAMRGKLFQIYFEMYLKMNKTTISTVSNSHTLAIVNVGAPAPGTNAALFSFIR